MLKSKPQDAEQTVASTSFFFSTISLILNPLCATIPTIRPMRSLSTKVFGALVA